MDLRKRLLQRIAQLKDPDSPLPIVTLEEFFDGNCFMESIIDEANRRYDPSVLYAMFRKFRLVAGIHDVFVEVKAVGREHLWPVADTCWVVAEADPRRYELPHEFFGGGNLPSDYLSYPRKDGRVTESIAIPDRMVAIGFQYYHLKD